MAGKRRLAGRASRNLQLRAGIRSPDSKANPTTPALHYVYAATEAGKISHEEGKELNSNYNPEKRYSFDPKNNKTQRHQYRQYQLGAAGFKPTQSDTILAYKMGHITEEEAKDLNPTFKPDGPLKVDVKRSGLKNNPIPHPASVAQAVVKGHINSEEADNLNPNWARHPNASRQFKGQP